MLYTVEPLYCGHLGDLVKYPVYSGTPLLRTPWGPGEVSCIKWNPSIMDTLGDLVKCPVQRDVLITFQGTLRKHTCTWDISKCPYFRVRFKRGSTVPDYYMYHMFGTTCLVTQLYMYVAVQREMQSL